MLENGEDDISSKNTVATDDGNAPRDILKQDAQLNDRDETVNNMKQSPQIELLDTSAKPALGKSSDDKKGSQRGKRLLGLVMGTLKRCKTELGQPSEASRKREEADMRVLEKLRLEKEELRRLQEEKELEKSANRKIHLESERVFAEETHRDGKAAKELRYNLLHQYLKTTPKPGSQVIYYLPKILTDAQQSLIVDSPSTSHVRNDPADTIEPEPSISASTE